MKRISLLVCFLVFSLNGWSQGQQDFNLIKKEILDLARANTLSTKNRVEIRSELNQLTAELIKDRPLVSEKQWVLFAPGPWKQIWSDERNNDPQNVKQNLNRVYQFVTPDGRAVNLGERIMLDGGIVTFALRAKGTVKGPIQTTEILSGFFMPSEMTSGTSIEELSMDILDETFTYFTPVQVGQFPNGPVGAKSDLNILYLDDDLKIGTAPNVFTGESEMFVLERAEYIQ